MDYYAITQSKDSCMSFFSTLRYCTNHTQVMTKYRIGKIPHGIYILIVECERRGLAYTLDAIL